MASSIRAMSARGEADGETRASALVAAFAALALLALVLALAAAPIRTNDLWFHLGAGRAYLAEGPWPAGDPMLHTAGPDAPVQHEWAFGVAVFALESALGLHGLRVVHAFAVIAIALAALAALRRAGVRGALCFAGLAVFLVLAWWRLIQLRPDLVSIPAALATYALLLARGDAPNPRRIALAAAIAFAWANAHSLFAIGPALALAALLGLALETALERALSIDADEHARAVRSRSARALAIAIAAMLAAALLNPRGIEQHLTFFTSSRDSAIWQISDEWRPFDPLSFPRGAPLVSPLAWGTANALGIGVLALALARLRALARVRSRRALGELDAAHLGLAVAGLVAVLVSVRFLWMGFFPLLYLARAAARIEGRAARRAASFASIGACALAIAFPASGGFAQRARTLPATLGEYVRDAYAPGPFYSRAARFLRDTRLEGNLFNRYTLGGYLGFWLAPRLRTFVDGRTEHYPPDVLDDYFRIASQSEVRPGESALAALDRRSVDVYLGVGLPVEDETYYTTPHLDGAPGWVLVSRSLDHAIFVRTNERNRANLARAADYHRERGVPFDPERGLEPLVAAARAPAWAIAEGIVPPDYSELVAAQLRGDPAARDRLALLAYLLGDYARAAQLDRETLERAPDASRVRERLVRSLLLLGEVGEAQLQADELLRRTRGDAPTGRVFRMLKQYEQLAIDPAGSVPPAAAVHATRFLSRAEMAAFYAAGAPLTGAVLGDE